MRNDATSAARASIEGALELMNMQGVSRSVAYIRYGQRMLRLQLDAVAMYDGSVSPWGEPPLQKALEDLAFLNSLLAEAAFEEKPSEEA